MTVLLACVPVESLTPMMVRTNIAAFNWGAAKVTPRPPKEPPIDMESNPAFSLIPHPPEEPPTNMDINPAVLASSTEPTIIAPIIEEEEIIVTSEDVYDELGVLAESLGKVAVGGAKAAILGLKAFYDTVSAP